MGRLSSGTYHLATKMVHQSFSAFLPSTIGMVEGRNALKDWWTIFRFVRSIISSSNRICSLFPPQ